MSKSRTHLNKEQAELIQSIGDSPPKQEEDKIMSIESEVLKSQKAKKVQPQSKEENISSFQFINSRS